MIKSFAHIGLKAFYETGGVKGIQANHAKKLRMQLAALETACEIEDLNIPGYRLHPLHGNRAGIWSVTVNGNWRLTSEFVDGNIHVLIPQGHKFRTSRQAAQLSFNYEDYH